MPLIAPTEPLRRERAAGWQQVLAGLAVLAYGVWFYTRPLSSLPLHEGRPWRRFELFEFLLVPDALYEQWLGGSVAPALADRAAILRPAIGLFFAAALYGRAVMQMLGALRWLTLGEVWWFSTVLGGGVLGTLTWCLGWSGWLDHSAHIFVGIVFPLGIGVLLVLLRRWFALPRPVAVQLSTENLASSRVPRAAWLVAVPFAALIVGGAMLPPVDFDVREYHLQAPKEFFQQGRIDFVPHNVYANMPLLAEMWALGGMIQCQDWWRGALVGKLLMGGTSLVAGWGLWLAGRRFDRPCAGVAAALLYGSTPWVVRLSASGLNEPALASFALAALYAAALWKGSLRDERRSAGLALLAGLAAGFATACKYPAALLVVLPVGVWMMRHAIGQRVRTAAAFLLGVAITWGPWLLKNWVETGNPVYPLLGSWLGCGAWTAEQIARWNAAHAPGAWTMAAWVTSAREVAGGADWQSPLVWPLALVALVTGWRRTEVRASALYVLWVLCGWWCLSHRVDRFWFSAMPLVCLLAGIGAADLWRSPWGRRALGTLGGACLAANLLFAALASPGYYNRFLMPLADARQDPLRVSAAQRWLNEAYRAGRLAGRGVLAVGEAEVFDLEPPVSYATAFDGCVLEARVRGRTDDEVRAALTPFALVLVRWDELARYRSTGNYGYSKFVTRDVLARLVAGGVLGPPVFRDPPADALVGDRLPDVEIYPVLPAGHR